MENRVIKFRGISKESSEMVYGYYHQDPEDGHFITDFEYVPVVGNLDEPPSGYFKKVVVEVIPESVGQFTGLLDKNCKEIYEGDHDQNFDIVAWCDKKNGWSMKIYDFPTKEVIACHCYNCEGDFELYELDDIEITGNIYENPNLLSNAN